MKFPKLGLYIHIPWCIRKCPYCDFYSVSIKKKKIPQKKYIKHLILDLKNDIKYIKFRKINTIFIGGGTPNLIKPKYIKYLIKNIKKIVQFSKKIEITFESNPNSINKLSYLKYKLSGINRISLGLQSFNEKILNNINRKYSYKKLIKKIKIVKSINFKKINFDLMYGLPGQKKKYIIKDLKKAISFKPSHISWYQLSIEKNTKFYKNTPILPKEKKIEKMYKIGKKILKKNNFFQYEISSYSNHKNKCKHNLNYWKYGDYLGIGCGAHGKITLKNKKIIRTVKKKNIHEFLNGKYIEKIYFVKKKNKPLEFFMNNFRLNQKCSKKNFIKKTGLKEKYIQKEILYAIKKKYIIQKKKYWKTTKLGKLFLNNLLEIFVK
ncbi:MAG: radical SAM family heme chaperone HemW [Buchnera aphidicola (Periphyllus acericola)]|uniref:radical SAM family heme chaperone HemW n=1 Tax=Buchnera aphidicola TaxID=9 RepID=UPI0030CE117F|nr:radical SAM family heme chaperone HemW [Buchnera aphidicola (Periphyllus acericola)]